MASFGETLTYFRNLKGISVEHVASELNISTEKLIAHEHDPEFLTLEIHDSYCKAISICPYEPFEHYFDIEYA